MSSGGSDMNVLFSSEHSTVSCSQYPDHQWVFALIVPCCEEELWWRLRTALGYGHKCNYLGGSLTMGSLCKTKVVCLPFVFLISLVMGLWPGAQYQAGIRSNNICTNYCISRHLLSGRLLLLHVGSKTGPLLTFLVGDCRPSDPKFPVTPCRWE